MVGVAWIEYQDIVMDITNCNKVTGVWNIGVVGYRYPRKNGNDKRDERFGLVAIVRVIAVGECFIGHG